MKLLEFWNTEEDLKKVLSSLEYEPVVGVDLETTALLPVRGELFAIVLSCPTAVHYLDFNHEPSHLEYCFRGTFRREILKSECLRNFFLTPRRWLAHNAKFDLGFLRKEGLEVGGEIWCTQTMARVQRNDHMRYSLDACAERIGEKKIDEVKKHLDAMKLFEQVEIPGKKGKVKEYHFEKVPAEVMIPYAEQDARLLFKLYESQLATFEEWNNPRDPSNGNPIQTKPIEEVLDLEKKTTRVILDMEYTGIRVDRDYCRKAATFEKERITEAHQKFLDLTGWPLVDSAKALEPIFRRFDLPFGKTEKGNPSFDSDTISKLDHPVAKTLLTYRDAQKRLGTYFSSFLHYSQWDGRIHASFNQAGTATGRFSSSNPNLQNLSDEGDEVPFPIRKAFIADEGELLLSIDYQAMEYRLMLDYAAQMDVIELVLQGHDVHEACAKLMGVTRREAKTINFLLLYGGGNQKLADALGVPLPKARELKELYFAKLPQVQEFIWKVSTVAARRGYNLNRYGRRYFWPDPKWAYKGPNYVIQGSCSDIMRRALWNIRSRAPGKLRLQIHDEAVLSIRKDELELVPELRDLMARAYEHKHLPMACASHVGESLHDLELVS